MKKYFLYLILILFLINGCVYAESATVTPPIQIQTPLTVPQSILYSDCTKIFNVNQEKLYFLTLGAITANKFNINEIQTADGYIIFSVAKKEYLATIAKVDSTNAILRITPCNDIYVFPPGILLNMFKYIELNLYS